MYKSANRSQFAAQSLHFVEIRVIHNIHIQQANNLHTTCESLYFRFRSRPYIHSCVHWNAPTTWALSMLVWSVLVFQTICWPVSVSSVCTCTTECYEELYLLDRAFLAVSRIDCCTVYHVKICLPCHLNASNHLPNNAIGSLSNLLYKFVFLSYLERLVKTAQWMISHIV